jgi:hypothetical protein
MAAGAGPEARPRLEAGPSPSAQVPSRSKKKYNDTMIDKCTKLLQIKLYMPAFVPCCKDSRVYFINETILRLSALLSHDMSDAQMLYHHFPS